MCGIAGIIAWDNRFLTTREQLARMSAAIAHRGPDAEGIWLNQEDNAREDTPQVGLVHRRLSIIDLDPRANQPFFDGEGRWIVFNGEIYNYQELRGELQKLRPEYRWKTSSDTEVLLAAYAAWGEDCVEHLNGMFAFAVWDGRAQSLFLARDRMGQKPLYYVRGSRSSARFVFASELSALRGFAEVRPASEWLLSYLQSGSTMEVRSVGAEQLRPGHTLRCRFKATGAAAAITDRNSEVGYDGYAAHEECYFDPNQVMAMRRDPACARAVIEQAVRRQLVSDVPVGVFLSGGIDSSIIAFCARQHGQVQTFSIAFDDPRYDESRYARLVADHLGTEHHELRATPDLMADLPKLAAAFGVPFADSSALPTHYLARETRAFVKVALSGDGGDELFGGYDRYRAMAVGCGQSWLLPLRPLGALLAKGHPKSKFTRLGRFLKSAGMSDGERYQSYMQLFDSETIGQLLGCDRQPFNAHHLAYNACRKNRDRVAAALALDRATYLPCDLLAKVDRCSMLHALEVRSPFMDHDVVQFAAGLATEQLLKGGPKRMLREAFAADLPDFVFKRTKMGFAVPIGEWFRSSLREMLHDHLFAADSFASQHFNRPVVHRLVDEHAQFRVDHSHRLYALLMLELWWRTQKAGSAMST